MNKRSVQWYYAGVLAGIAFLVGAELLWLPAPLRTGGGMEWIEWIDWLYYTLAIVPICWLIGALHRLTAAGGNAALSVVRWGLAAASAATALSIWISPDRMLLTGACAAAALLLLFIDLLAAEAWSRRGMPWRSIGALAVMLLLLAATAMPTGYQVTYPAMTLNLNRYAHIEGGGATGGSISGVLVSYRPAVLADRLYGALFPQYRFEPIPEDEPPLSEIYAQAIAMKTDANRVATAIALQKAGIGQGAVADGVRVVAIVKDSPADGALQAGDIIDAVDGAQVSDTAGMIDYMSAEVKPGDEVTVTVRRGVEKMNVEVATVPSEAEANRAVFGVSVQTEVRLDTPRSVTYNDYKAYVGGPSHGAMLTLALLDQLIAGGVAGGLRVAGTGTIEPDGTVGMVGGIPQKAYAVSRTDADVFFVPAAGEEAARSGAPDLNIVAVDTFDDILAWLSENGK